MQRKLRASLYPASAFDPAVRSALRPLRDGSYYFQIHLRHLLAPFPFWRPVVPFSVALLRCIPLPLARAKNSRRILVHFYLEIVSVSFTRNDSNSFLICDGVDYTESYPACQHFPKYFCRYLNVIVAVRIFFCHCVALPSLPNTPTRHSSCTSQDFRWLTSSSLKST